MTYHGVVIFSIMIICTNPLKVQTLFEWSTEKLNIFVSLWYSVLPQIFIDLHMPLQGINELLYKFWKFSLTKSVLIYKSFEKWVKQLVLILWVAWSAIMIFFFIIHNFNQVICLTKQLVFLDMKITNQYQHCPCALIMNMLKWINFH